MRDFELVLKISAFPDEVLIGPDEVAALTALSPITVRQRKIRGFPAPVDGIRRLRWRLGDVRGWIHSLSTMPLIGKVR